MGPEFFGGLAQAPADDFWWPVLAAAALSAGTLWFGFRKLRHARLMMDLPTSRIASAAQGYVELEGRALLLPGPEVISPLTGRRCAWWQFSVERKERGRDNKTRWRVVERATSEELFLLVDPTGECVVDPFGATVIPSGTWRWHGHTRRPNGPPPARRSWLAIGDYRYTERLVELGTPLYVLGLFRTQHGQACFDERAAVRELLAEWKRDQAELLRRFDADGDGQISLEEWAAVRKAALDTVRQQQVQRAVQPDLNILSRPTDRRPYLLSTTPEAVLVRVKKRKAFALIAVGVVAFAFAMAALEARFF